MKVSFHPTVLFCFIFVCLCACRSSQTTRPVVSVSILPQKYFVERIAKDEVKVNVMIPPGMNPATCDLSIGQLKELYDSDIYFAVGFLPFEHTHLYPILTRKPEILLVRHSDSLQLLAGSCGHHHSHPGENVDPHIWLSPAYAQHICRQIVETLSRKYPDKREFFTANYNELKADIDLFAQEAMKVLSTQKNKAFLIYHPALTYFAHDYGLEQISIENEGKEPHPAHLKEIVDEARNKSISVIFIQKQFDIQNAEAVARSTGSRIVPIDPLNENWLEEMYHLLEVFRENSSD